MSSIDRRRLLGGTAALSLVAGVPVRAQAVIETRLDVALDVAYDDTGQPIPPDFLGLSYESAILVDGNYFSPVNPFTLGLIGRLGRSGVIRVGGNTSAHTAWRAQDEPAAPESLAITPRSILLLTGTLARLGWKLIYGLNLAGGTPEAAAEEAAYVAGALGANLLAFQIGNEPDGFGGWTAVRPATYDAAAYLGEWKRFHDAVRARVPDARFAGPDVAAASDWIASFAEARLEGVTMLTSHYYAEGPAGAAGVTLSKLLTSDQQADAMLVGLAHTASAYRLPFRIVEANSVYNEGEPGVSDTLGSALWGLEFLFQAARAGAAGVNFHTGVHNARPAEDKAYSPIARGADGRYAARPLYYGMLMFAQAASGALVPVHLAPENADLRAFAVRAPKGCLRVCLINKNPSRAARVRIDAGASFADAAVMRLAGPSLDATRGVTLGRSNVDAATGWAPAPENGALNGHGLMVDMSAASAALVDFQSTPRGCG
jgi:hypothetical protein